MKNILILIITFLFCSSINGQDRFKKDSLMGFKFIKNDSLKLAQRNINNALYIFDDTGNMLIVWKEKKKYKSKTVKYKSSFIKPNRKKLGKKQKLNAIKLLENPSLINSINDNFCSKNNDFFSKINIYIFNKNESVKHGFYSHCISTKMLKKSEILSLYYGLKYNKRE